GLVNGRVLQPDGVDEVDSVYPRLIGYHKIRGSSSKWRKTVGVQAIGHPHLQFASLLPLTAGLADMLGERHPIIIEYVCPPSSSRQDLVITAASVTGSVAIGATPFISFAADPATMLERHKGTVLVLDDPALAFAAETTAKSQSILIDVVRSFASSGKGPTACLIVGTKALADWAGCHTETAALLQDQVITIVIDEERPFGIYQSAGDGGVALASAEFQDAASNAHGALYQDFMQKLVQSCSDGEPELRAVIERRIRAFLVWANSDPNNQIAAQQARVFGLIYATGWLAKKHQILPLEWQVTKVVARVFRSRLRKGISPKSVPEIISDIASARSTLRLDSAVPPTLAQIEGENAFIRGVGLKRKLFIRQTAISEFPELHARIHESATKKHMVSPDPISSKQRLGAQGLTRVYAFRAPDVAVEQEPEDV
ncbi:MAG: hypothetical protein ACRYGP_08630, partial [Janthinobacterium lividum]